MSDIDRFLLFLMAVMIAVIFSTWVMKSHRHCSDGSVAFTWSAEATCAPDTEGGEE